MVDLFGLINLVDFSIISAALGVLAGVINSIFASRRAERQRQTEIETRQAQLFMNIYLHMATEEAMKTDYDLFNIEFKDIDEWNEIFKDKKKYTAWNMWSMYFEGVGLLVRKQFLDIDIVARLYSGAIMSWWEKYEAGIKALREHYGWPRFMIEAEYLYNRVMEYGMDHPELEIAAPPLYQSKP